MNWNYYIPHEWDTPQAAWEDIWLWPIDVKIAGNMNGKINLTIDAISNLPDDSERDRKLRSRLEADNSPYWIWPYPEADFWTDDVSMIVNCAAFSRSAVVHYAEIYLKHSGYTVDSLQAVTIEDALANIDDDTQAVSSTFPVASARSVHHRPPFAQTRAWCLRWTRPKSAITTIQWP